MLLSEFLFEVKKYVGLSFLFTQLTIGKGKPKSKNDYNFIGFVAKTLMPCKIRSDSANPSLTYFGERLSIPHLYQIHLEGQKDFLDGKVRVMPAARFLAALP